MPEPSSLSEYLAQVDTKFRVATGSGTTIELELIEAVAEPSRPARPGIRADPFSLCFRGPFAPGLPQMIHRLDHAVLGSIALFLVPIGPEGDALGTHYQAVFN